MLQLIFIAISFLALVLFYYGTGKNKRILAFSLLWLFLSGGMAYAGFFENTAARPPRFLLVAVVAVLLSIYFFKTITQSKIRPMFLVAVHILRVPVELVLYKLFLVKQVPVLMTFKGWNFDIITGIVAILILFYLLLVKSKLPRYFILTWNITGLFFLTTIVVIAILSAPLPIQQLAFDQPNVALLKFPFIYLPAYIVPVVYLSHFLSIKNVFK